MAKQVKENTNVKVSFDGKKGVIRFEVDVKAFLEREELELVSESGKSYIIGSTHGQKKFESERLEGLIYSLNVYTMKKFYDEQLLSKRNKEEAQAVVAEIEAKKKLQANPALEKLANLDDTKLAKLLALVEALS
jgi:hypothetical protein